MEATWGGRELPVLEAVIGQIDLLPLTSQWPDARDIASITGLALADVGAALAALDDVYITLMKTVGVSSRYVTAVTPEARRAVGQWPTAESLIEQLATRIGEAAEREADPERKGRLQAVARGLGGVASEIAVNVASAFIERSAPHL
jgi:hypothetical protein